ncbi:hypothetical protein NPIL_327471 [Nephila pilipes]|uniref:Uncharacterized protein n=1 Tax=Nephila pilipes TaxID=299642 RepID=A0A8X6TP55_NEPPI|nr:hypothetical protein NPIL_327471 [Nephila pilipes]
MEVWLLNTALYGCCAAVAVLRGSRAALVFASKGSGAGAVALRFCLVAGATAVPAAAASGVRQRTRFCCGTATVVCMAMALPALQQAFCCAFFGKRRRSRWWYGMKVLRLRAVYTAPRVRRCVAYGFACQREMQQRAASKSLRQCSGFCAVYYGSVLNA